MLVLVVEDVVVFTDELEVFLPVFQSGNPPVELECVSVAYVLKSQQVLRLFLDYLEYTRQ